MVDMATARHRSDTLASDDIALPPGAGGSPTVTWGKRRAEGPAVGGVAGPAHRPSGDEEPGALVLAAPALDPDASAGPAVEQLTPFSAAAGERSPFAVPGAGTPFSVPAAQSPFAAGEAVVRPIALGPVLDSEVVRAEVVDPEVVESLAPDAPDAADASEEEELVLLEIDDAVEEPEDDPADEPDPLPSDEPDPLPSDEAGVAWSEEAAGSDRLDEAVGPVGPVGAPDPMTAILARTQPTSFHTEEVAEERVRRWGGRRDRSEELDVALRTVLVLDGREHVIESQPATTLSRAERRRRRRDREEAKKASARLNRAAGQPDPASPATMLVAVGTLLVVVLLSVVGFGVYRVTTGGTSSNALGACAVSQASQVSPGCEQTPDGA